MNLFSAHNIDATCKNELSIIMCPVEFTDDERTKVKEQQIYTDGNSKFCKAGDCGCGIFKICL